MILLRPSAAQLPAYVEALRRGWSPDTVRGAAAAAEELQRIDADAASFLRFMDDPEALGPPVTLADGRQVPRIPGLRRWMWDDTPDLPDEQRFIGVIGLRWLPGNAPLPPHVLGHVGYSVVRWRWGEGHATRALALVLPLARAQGLTRLEITTDPGNLASQRVMTANGATLLGAFDKGPTYGHRRGLRFEIRL